MRPDRRAGRGRQAEGRRHRLRQQGGRREASPLRKIRDQNDKVEAATRQARDLRRIPQGQRPQVPRLPAPGIQHPVHRGGGEPAVRRGPGGRAQAVRRTDERPRSRPPSATAFFAERQAAQDPRRAGRHRRPSRSRRSASSAPAPWAAASPMNFANAGIPVTIVEHEAGTRWTAAWPPSARTTSAPPRAARMHRGRRREAHGAADHRLAVDWRTVGRPSTWSSRPCSSGWTSRRTCSPSSTRSASPARSWPPTPRCLNIDEIASVTKRPESVIGLHFFSPANVMKLLEIVRGRPDRQGRDRHLDEAGQEDRQGRGAGRASAPASSATASWAQRQREAQKLVLEGAMPWDVDRVLYDFGFPMGPFAMSDLAGLDIGWVKEKLEGRDHPRRAVRDGPPRPEDRRRATTTTTRTASPSRQPGHREGDQRLHRRSRAPTRARSATRRSSSAASIPMINEGAKILEEGKAIRASDVDVVWINGYGWPVYRGGPMFYGDQVGPAKVLAKMKEFQAKHGRRLQAGRPAGSAWWPRARGSRTPERSRCKALLILRRSVGGRL